MIWVRSRENIQEMWPEIKSGKIALWCDGLKKKSTVTLRAKRKLKVCEFGDSDEEEDDTVVSTARKKDRQRAKKKYNIV